MSTLSLLHLDGRWLSFDGDRVRHLDARPRLDRAAIAITDFDGAVSQVIALEGSPSHAVALIERRLRADGLIDNESKILIHKTKTVGNGYQALFTAVPLDRWQQMFAWGEGHDDHCLLMPSVALLWRMLRPGRGIVLHSGRQFTFVACLRNRIVHASALAFSETENDLTMTVAALAERAGRELAGADEALETLTVEWYGSLTRAPGDAGNNRIVDDGGMGARTRDSAAALLDDDTPTQRTAAGDTPAPFGEAAADADADADADAMTFDGQFDQAGATPPVVGPPAASPAPAVQPGGIARGRWTDEALLEIFSANSGTTVRLGPHTMVRDDDGALYRSGIAKLVAGATALAAVNPPASRLMYLAERVLPWASAASLLLALALGGLGGRWALAANDAHGRAEALDAQIAQVETEIAGLQSRQALPESYPQLLRFVERAGRLQRSLDPNAALRDLRVAAGSDVRILRLRLEPADAEQGERLRVDGMVNHQLDRDSQGMQVARFVQRLRAIGYVPEAIDPQMGSVRSQSPGGSFSYQLRRADAVDAVTGEQPTEKAS